MSTKKERQKVVAEKTEVEKNQILKIMRDADIYTLTLDPLIESFTDIFESIKLCTLNGKKWDCQLRSGIKIKLMLQIIHSIHWLSK
ncbi:hypothetical protein [Bacillus cereus group sp. N12]|uniref:hypothetical protein n=1 Tax=Bacillus cereus group sp. N12 TaxID=2794586 RepID=UPI0035ABF603